MCTVTAFKWDFALLQSVKTRSLAIMAHCRVILEDLLVFNMHCVEGFCCSRLTHFMFPSVYSPQMTMPPRNQLQLVGVTAMLLASKYEEIYAPEIEDFVFITDNTYTASQIRGMEVKMLAGLGFELGKPFCLQFLRRNSKAGHVSCATLFV